MRHVRFPVLSLVAMAFVVAAFASSSEAVTVTCDDDGLTYVTECPPSGGGGTRCINGSGSLNGCCNKGTCTSGGVCNTGQDQDFDCNDENDCTDDFCTQLNYQGHCNNLEPNPAPSPARSCNTDNNVCTKEVCSGTTCTSTGVTDTCAAEQASNPTSQPVCRPWTCDPVDGCDKRPVPNSPPVLCDDGQDCTTGDHCVNGTCAKGNGGSNVNGYPCRDDDTNLADGDQRTWCRKGQCDGGDDCPNSSVTDVPNGGSCDPNNCTNATCVGAGASGTCIINSCNAGQSVPCAPCGTTLTCVNHQVGQNANVVNGCGCLSLF